MKFKKRQIPWNKGIKCPWMAEITRNRMRGRFRENHPSWKGGKYITSQGYIRIYKPEWQSSDNKGYVFEHRYVIERYLGRYLEPWEVIHHKNGIKDDNRIENLEIVIRKKHYGNVRCPYCSKEFLIQ